MVKIKEKMRCHFCLAIVGFFLLFFDNIKCQYRTKNSESTSMAKRVQQLSEMANEQPVLKFNAAKFKEFIKATPRNYSIVVMFTSMASKRKCHLCHYGHDEFTIVADSFHYSQAHSNKLFFAAVDFDGGKDIFRMLKIDMAPVYMHFPPKGKPKAADTMDIQRQGLTAHTIQQWISRQTNIQFRVSRPPNWIKIISSVMLLVLIGGFLYLKRNNLHFIYGKTIWALGSLFFTLAMISGQMWNHIRGPPFFHLSANGIAVYIYGSSQGQFVLETYIVMILNGAVVLGMILMMEAAKRKGDVKKRRILAVIGLGLVTVFFSLLLSIFRNKTGGYPYRLLFS